MFLSLSLRFKPGAEALKVDGACRSCALAGRYHWIRLIVIFIDTLLLLDSKIFRLSTPTYLTDGLFAWVRAAIDR